MAHDPASSQQLRQVLAHPFANRLTLRFHEPLESRFREHYCAQFLTFTRQAFALALVLYVVYAVLDRYYFPDYLPLVWGVRFGVVCPVLIAGLVASRTRIWPRIFLPATALMLFVCTGGLMMVIWISGLSANLFMVGGMPLCLIFGYTFVRSRYVYITAVSLLLTALAIAAAIDLGMERVQIAHAAIGLVAINLVGTYALRSFEYFVRMSFVQSIEIGQRNEELQEANGELSQANRQLAESRAEIVRSGARAELIFNALTEALPGSVLDEKYRIESKLGTGGFGTVYRARHLLMDGVVAIKVFKPVAGHDAKRSLERMRAEGATAHRVSHPNAVRVLDFGISLDSVAYLVMEYLEGHGLDTEITDGRPLPLERALLVLHCVSEALAHAHEVGVVHRDIKPSNVFFNRSGEDEQVKLVDFGIAKLIGEESDIDFKNLTATGLFVGTPKYMAPERFTNQRYDGKSDVYSLGVLAYELIAGRRPFVGAENDYMPVALKHMNERAQPIEELVPDVPAELAELVARMLAKIPQSRPSAREVAAILAQLREPRVAGQA